MSAAVVGWILVAIVMAVFAGCILHSYRQGRQSRRKTTEADYLRYRIEAELRRLEETADYIDARGGDSSLTRARMEYFQKKL